MLSFDFSPEHYLISVALVGERIDGLFRKSPSRTILAADIFARFPETSPILALPGPNGSTKHYEVGDTRRGDHH